MLIEEAIAELKRDLALAAVRETMAQGIEPLEIVQKCQQGMAVVGQRFEKGDYFLAELMHSARIFQSVMAVIEEKFDVSQEDGASSKVVIGTAAGDVHDIGKNIVVMVLKANGFRVTDLGVDVKVQKFVEEVNRLSPSIVGISVLLTTAFDSLKETCRALRKTAAGATMKIIIGGGPVNEQVRQYCGADYYVNDVMAGVKICRSIVG